MGHTDGDSTPESGRITPAGNGRSRHSSTMAFPFVASPASGTGGDFPSSVDFSRYENHSDVDSWSICEYSHLEGHTQLHNLFKEDDEEKFLTLTNLMVLFPASLGSFLTYLSIAQYVAFFSIPAKDEYGAGDFEIGLVYSLFPFFLLISVPVVSRLAVRFGPLLVMMIGLVVLGLSTIGFGLGKSMTVFYIMRSIQGIGGAAATVSGTAILTREFAESVGPAIGFRETLTGTAFIFSPVVGGLLYDVGGFILPFAVIGSIPLVAAAPCYLILTLGIRRKRERKAAQLPSKSDAGIQKARESDAGGAVGPSIDSNVLFVLSPPQRNVGDTSTVYGRGRRKEGDEEEVEEGIEEVEAGKETKRQAKAEVNAKVEAIVETKAQTETKSRTETKVSTETETKTATETEAGHFILDVLEESYQRRAIASDASVVKASETEKAKAAKCLGGSSEKNADMVYQGEEKGKEEEQEEVEKLEKKEKGRESRESEENEEEAAATIHMEEIGRRDMLNRTVLVGTAGVFMVYGVFGFMEPLLEQHLHRILGASAGAVGLLYGTASVCYAGGAPMGGHLIQHRISPRSLGLLSLFVLSVPLFLWGPPPFVDMESVVAKYVLVIVSFVVIGTCAGFAVPSFYTILEFGLPDKSGKAEMASGLLTASEGAATTSVPLLAGALLSVLPQVSSSCFYSQEEDPEEFELSCESAFPYVSALMGASVLLFAVLATVLLPSVPVAKHRERERVEKGGDMDGGVQEGAVDGEARREA